MVIKMKPQVSTNFVCLGILSFAAQVFWIEIATADCGPFEDNSRTTYRQLQCADFRGPWSANDTAYIVTSIRVSWADVLVEPKGEEWVARFDSVCVQAFMHKEVSGLHKKKCKADSLTHEQHHFGITQHFAQSLGSVLEDLEHRASSQLEAAPGLQERTKMEYAGSVTRWKMMNARYDRATLNGVLEMSPKRMAALLPTRINALDPITDKEQKVTFAH